VHRSADDDLIMKQSVKYRVTTGPGKSWKVMEFRKTIFQAWKVMENNNSHEKSWKSHGN